MENFFFPLKSVTDTWLSSSTTPWVMDVILGILCGLGLFLLLCAFFPSNPPGPLPHRKMNVGKRQVELRGKKKSRKKDNVLKHYRYGRKQQEEVEDTNSLLSSLLDEKPSHQDTLSEGCRPAQTGTYQPCGKCVQTTSPPSYSLLAPVAPLPECPLPLASTVAAECQKDQYALKNTPGSCVPGPLPPGNLCLLPPFVTLWAITRLSCLISIVSLWWAIVTALFLSTWSPRKSQQKHLSPQSPDAPFCKDPMDKMAEAGGLTFVSSEVQNLLEILIAKRAEEKLRKKKTGEGLFLKQLSPGCPLDPLGNRLHSLGHKRDLASSQPFWIRKDKPQQLSGSPQLSYPTVSKDAFQQRCSQLCWGLPSLHSESLVATAWVSSKPAPCSSNSVKSNRPSSTLPAQIAADIPSQLPQGQPLPHAAPLPQPVPQNLSPPGAQFKSQDSLPNSVPTLPCSSHTMDCRTSQPATQKRARSLIVTGEQQQEQSLQNPQKWKSVNTELRKPQASFGQATPSLSQDRGASETHQSVPTLPGDSISPEVQGQQQRHTQQRLIKSRYPESPPWEFQEQMQPQGKFPEEYPSRTRDRAEPSQPSLAMGKSSKVVRKVRGRPYIRFCKVPAEVKREKSPDKDPGQNLKRSPADLPRGSRLSSQEVLQDAQGETERPTTRPWKCDSDSFLFSSPDENHFQKTLKAHLGNKLGQVTEDRVPVSVCQSCLATSSSAPRPDTCLSPRYVASREGPGSYMNTSQELPFLPQSTRQRLETCLARGRVRPRWGPQLQTLKPRCVQLGEPQHLPLPQSTLPFLVTHGSGTSLRAKVATVLEDAPRKAPGQEGLTKAIPNLQTPLSAPSPAFKKVQATPSQIPASSTAQWARWSSQPLTGSLKGRTEQRVITGIGRSGQEPRPHPAPARSGPQEQRRSEASPDSCHLRKSLYRSTGSQSLRTGGTMGLVKPKEKGPTCKIVVGAHTLANSQTISVSLSSARSPGRSQSRSPAAQKVDVPGPITQDVGDLDIKVEIQAEHRAQSPACGVLLQDLTTGIISQGRTAGMSITDYHRDVVSRASRATPDGSQSLSSTKVSAAQESRAFTRTAGSSQGQHVPRSRIVQSPWKNQTQMSGPDTTGGYKRPRSGGQEQRLGGPTCSQTSGMNHPAQSRGIRNVFGSKDPELLEEKRQAPPENYFRKTMTKLVEYFNPIKKSKEQEEPLQEGKPPTVTAQHRGPVMGKVFSDSRGADAQALSEIVAEIMLNELKLQHAEGPSKFNCHKDYFQPAVGRRSGNHSGPSYPEQRRLMKDVASGHQATSRGHSSTKNRWIRDKDSKWIPSAWESVPQANPKQHRPRGAGSTDCPIYSPGHYLLQRDVPSGPSGPPPHSFPAGKNLQAIGRKFTVSSEHIL